MLRFATQLDRDVDIHPPILPHLTQNSSQLKRTFLKGLKFSMTTVQLAVWVADCIIDSQVRGGSLAHHLAWHSANYVQLLLLSLSLTHTQTHTHTHTHMCTLALVPSYSSYERREKLPVANNRHSVCVCINTHTCILRTSPPSLLFPVSNETYCLLVGEILCVVSPPPLPSPSPVWVCLLPISFGSIHTV